MYRVKMRIWHTAEGRYVEAGEVVNLDHLDESALAHLLEAGIIQEVKDRGPNNRGNKRSKLQD